MDNSNEVQVSQEELKKAFQAEKKSKKPLVSLIILIIGIIFLLAGVVFLIISFTRETRIQDGEYLLLAKEWLLDEGEDCVSSDEDEINCTPSVIWKFTEIGKGTLTTNGHIDDYDFIWAIEDKKLKIETDWLYPLNNEYDYELNQDEGKLVLTDGEEVAVLRASFEDE